MKKLAKLPGKSATRKTYPRISLICLGILYCDGTLRDKAEVLFGLLDPECDSTGQFGITHKQWCESNIFEIIIEIALQIHKYDYDGKNVIQTMKFGDKKLIKGFTSHLFDRKNWLSKANFIQRAKTDKINWLFEVCTVQDQYNYHLEAWM